MKNCILHRGESAEHEHGRRYAHCSPRSFLNARSSSRASSSRIGIISAILNDPPVHGDGHTGQLPAFDIKPAAVFAGRCRRSSRNKDSRSSAQ